MNRRNWLRTAAGVLVAPAVVRAESLMRVRPIELPSVVEAGLPMPDHGTINVTAFRPRYEGWAGVTRVVGQDRVRFRIKATALWGVYPGALISVNGTNYEVTELSWGP